MKTLLHNPVTHLFLKEIGEWTIDPEQAMHFSEFSEAEKYCRDHHLYDVQLFLKLDAPYRGVAEELPVTHECRFV